MATMRSLVCLMLVLASATATFAFKSDGAQAVMPGNVAGPNPIECKACEYSVTKLEGFLESKDTVTKIENGADALCSKVLPDKVDECEALVQFGINYALSFIKKNAKPDDVCKDAGACKAVDAVAFVADKIRKADVKDDKSCHLCQFVLTQAKSFISDDDAKEKKEQA